MFFKYFDFCLYIYLYTLRYMCMNICIWRYKVYMEVYARDVDVQMFTIGHMWLIAQKVLRSCRRDMDII